MNPATRRSGGGAEIHIGIGHMIGIKKSGWTCKQLCNVLLAAVYVTANIIWIVIVHGPGIHGMLPDYYIPKPGCKPFNLVEYRFCHVTRRS